MKADLDKMEYYRDKLAATLLLALRDLYDNHKISKSTYMYRCEMIEQVISNIKYCEQRLLDIISV